MEITTYGLDLAKRVMQMHWVDMETGEIHRKQLRRQALLEFFANRPAGIVAMEACGSAHYWARCRIKIKLVTFIGLKPVKLPP